jgi:hypothetical protein
MGEDGDVYIYVEKEIVIKYFHFSTECSAVFILEKVVVQGGRKMAVAAYL